MEMNTTKADFKKDFLHLFNAVGHAKKNLKFINNFFLKELKPDYEELQKMSKSNLRRIADLYKDKAVLPEDKEKLLSILEDMIYLYGEILCTDCKYELFLTELADELGIILQSKELEFDTEIIKNFLIQVSSGEQHEEEDEESCKYFKRTIHESGFNENAFTEEENLLINDLVKGEVLSDAEYLIKYRFWCFFIELKRSLDKILGEKDSLILSEKNKSKYKKEIEESYLSYSYIGLLSIYRNIALKFLIDIFRNPKKKYQDILYPEFENIRIYMLALYVYHIPEIPSRLTSPVLMAEKYMIKELLKAEKERLNQELVYSLLIEYGLNNKEFLTEYVSELEANENSFFGKVIFTLTSVFKTIS